MLLATDWATISSLVTGFGTLVLAIATFAAVRSSNRSARIAEAALQEQRRPVLAPSRFNDPVQKIMFVEGHWIRADGGRGAAEHIDGIVFLGISLRNVGSGMAVCQGWAISPALTTSKDLTTHAPLDEFRLQSRDLYVPAGDVGMWQGALRDPEGSLRAAIAQAIEDRQTLSIELLYTDQVGGQRTITRFALVPTGDTWLASVNRHWYLDWDGPRPESLVRSASETVLREREAAERRAAESTAPESSDADGGGASPDASASADGDGAPALPPGTRIVQPAAPAHDG